MAPIPNLRRACRVAWALAVVACVVPAATASAAPGFEPLSVAPVALGAGQDEPVPVVHAGRLYVAFIAVDHDRRELVVKRSTSDGHWEPVGSAVSDVGARAFHPRLVSHRDELYVGWAQASRADRRRSLLCVARLVEQPQGGMQWDQWLRAAPDVRPRPARPLEMVMLADRPTFLFEDTRGAPMIGVATERAWELTPAHELIPQTARVDHLAAFGSDRLYLAYTRWEEVPGAPSLVPHAELGGARLADGGRFIPIRPLELPDAAGARAIAVDGRRGERPVLAWSTDRKITVAQLNFDATTVTVLAEIPIDAAPYRLLVARLADGVAVGAQMDRNSLVVYHITGDPGARNVVTEPVPGRGRGFELTPGPEGRAVIAYMARDAGAARAVLLGETPPS